LGNTYCCGIKYIWIEDIAQKVGLNRKEKQGGKA
jgi:hypothetical protein